MTALNVEMSKYFVHTSKCRIPYIDPFSPEVMEIYSPRTFIPCSNESDLVSALYDASLKRYVLHINEQVAQKLLNSSDQEYNCFYREIQLGKETETYDMLNPSIYFSQNYVVPLHVEGLLLQCETAEIPPVTLQKDAYMFIQYQPSGKTSKPNRSNTPQPRKPSVLMYGIDTLSRINVRRTMPSVYKYLTGPGWYEMRGYNKVGDNSFPNILAILSGYSPEKAKEHVCDTDNEGCLDEIPMIWKYFRNASYLTAYAEDESASNTFSYLKPGFTKKPTDYYFRPFLRALECEADNYNLPDCHMTYCYGRRLANSYIYDYCRQFMQRYVKERPIWGMFWSNHFSHDDIFMASAMQNKVLGDLRAYEKDGSLEHTIMIFFADHGVRFGSLLSLSEGYLEERLPMMFIYLPPWFRKQYPHYAAALAQNQHRLCSNFDLHNTLKHIIEIGGTPDGPALPKSYDCPTCQSLFHPIAESRTCPEAGIADHWCTCNPYRRITKLYWSHRIAPLVIERMNDYFVQKNLSQLCSNLSLHYIHNTEIRTGVDVSWEEDLPQVDVAVYRTKFKVQQNGADFEATVIFNNITEALEVNVESISRTNSYKEDSMCINDKIAKLYCICFDSLQP
ncbi:GH25084 [Drosophila grimshawi]|uniref:GH25084 n=2 Tax=Drosophila grimshawi TaxID=7222 RepID=B4JZE2_DROGR|nr:GH25084 [Drosophila grimshawi]